MGVEIIRLGGGRETIEPVFKKMDLASPRFQRYHVPASPLSIWLMSLPPAAALFPWWKYDSNIDGDMNALSQAWSISNAQNLFDCLFLSSVMKFAGGNLFAVFPGSIKNTGWSSLRPIDQETFNRGQACIYHLHGAYGSRLAINWIPFWEPQSLVRNPGFGSLWRLFSGSDGDGTSRCLTLFSLSDPKSLPEAINLFLTKDDFRSEKLAGLVDWFAMYSSPLNSTAGTAAVVYTQKEEVLRNLENFQTQILAQLALSQSDLLAETTPRTALKILSRQIAL